MSMGVVGALIIHDPDDPYLNEYDEEIIVMLTDYHHTESEILLKKFLTPSSEGDEAGVVRAFFNESSYVPDIKFPTLSRIFAGKANNLPRDRNAYIFDTPGEVVDITFITKDNYHGYF
ncbi:hypothetical protein RhiirC2_717506 [Rhizophagus irregularis]|uniref:Uncharacterized protein n=1 Tax=Rhizophagus irregularis TaxID=588596 RepID=A0A2N1MM66_9GLOM|nr:hypothetical protein RhiirC2_717506 [Rhizophagus irregularis]